MPSWLVLLRIVRSCDFSGPADGRQLALKVPGLTIQTMVAQGSFCMSSRRQRWTFIPPKLWKLGFSLLAFSGLVWSGSCFLVPGVSCCSLGCCVPFLFLGSVERFWSESRRKLMSDRDHSSGGTGCLSPNAHQDGVQVWTVRRKSTGIDFHPLMTHPYGWMRHELSIHTAR